MLIVIAITADTIDKHADIQHDVPPIEGKTTRPTIKTKSILACPVQQILPCSSMLLKHAADLARSFQSQELAYHRPLTMMFAYVSAQAA